MNATATAAQGDLLEPEAETGALVVMTEATMLATLTDAKKFYGLVEKMRAVVAAHVPDTKTDKGRKAIATLARKVVTTKTTLDAAGKKLTEDARAQIAVVDASRKNIRDTLDALRDEARAPLTNWEDGEKRREALVKDAIETLKGAAFVASDATIAAVQGQIAALDAIVIEAAMFQEWEALALDLQRKAREALGAAIDRIKLAAAQEAELAAFRAEAAERAAREALAAEKARIAALWAAKEAKEKADAEAAEAARVENERLAKVAAEEAAAKAAEAAKVEAERVAEAALQKARDEAAEAQRQRDAAHAAELAAAQAETARLAAEAAAAATAKAAQEAREKAEAEAERAAQAARDADTAHRLEVVNAAAEAIQTACGVGEEEALAVMHAIAAGLIPAVTVKF